MRLDLPDGYYLGSIQDGDQAAYVEHFADKDTTDRLLKIPYPYTEEDAENWVQFRLEAARKEPRETSFALRRADGFLIGGAGIVLNSGTAIHRGEMGYWVAKDYRNRGLATAAVSALSQYAFQSLGLRRIEAIPFSHNPASCRVLEKAGFKCEGLLAAYYFKNGILLDAYMYALVKTEARKTSPVSTMGRKEV